MKDIKLIAIDLDGTLMDLGCRVDPRDAAALRAACGRGVTLVVCTGRAVHHVPPSVRALDFIPYYITSNGSRVTDMRTGAILAQHVMTKEKVLEVVDTIEPFGAAFNIHSEGYDLSDERSFALLKKLGAFEDFVSMGCATRVAPDIRALVNAQEPPLQKMLVMFPSAEESEAARQALGHTQGIEVTTSFAKTLEITAAGVRKDASLAWLCARLGVAREQTAAIGDSANDIDMLRFAGTGIAMGNAGDDAKAAADYVTAGIADAGVARAVEYLLDPPARA